MASELPGGKSPRRKLAWKDDRSTNKIYASGDQSAISPSCADSTLKPGEAPQANPTKLPKQDDRSANKYYKAAPLAPTAQQIARGQGALPPVPELSVRAAGKAVIPQRAKHAIDPNSPQDKLLVLEPREVNSVTGEIARRLNDGENAVKVIIKYGDAALLKRVRTALELLVTREIISEDQLRDVRFSYQVSENEHMAINKKLGSAPTPRGVVNVSEPEAPIDPLAFLSGEGEDLDDPIVDTSPIKPTQVDTSKDVPSAPPVEEFDEDTFLDTPVPVVANPEPLVKTPSPVAVTTPSPITVKTPVADKPVPITAEKQQTLPANTGEAMPGIGDAPKKLDTGKSVGDTGKMDVMDGIGEAPKKPGKSSGRGAK